MFRLACEHRADLDRLDGRCVDAVGGGVVDLLAGLYDNLAGGGVDDVVNRNAAEDALAQRGHDLVVVLDLTAYKTAQRTAVFLADDHVVCHVDQTAGKVTGVGGLEGGIGKTLSGTVGRDEVLEHRQTLLEVRKNRVLDDLAAFGTGFLGLGHKATHTGQLTDLVF